MSSLLKDMYSPAFYDQFCDVLVEVIPAFDRDQFVEMIFAGDWDQKELKDRMRHTAVVLHHFLPGDFPEAARMIKEVIVRLQNGSMPVGTLGFEFMFFPDYIENYGLDDFTTSVESIGFVTQFASCEFAVRPFILKYGDRMIARMQEWSLHESWAVRRLATEGMRPRLPWAVSLPGLKKNPAAILPILERLKADPHESVRRSVSNNLNDISKDHPQVVIDIARQWMGRSKETDLIVRHGCRTLLKQGNPDILGLYKLAAGDVEISGFVIKDKQVRMGDELTFSFTVRNACDDAQVVRIEYAIFYLRLNGQHSKKVFQVNERLWQPGEKNIIVKKQSFREITTRKFYPGSQQLSIIINGEEKAKEDFELL